MLGFVVPPMLNVAGVPAAKPQVPPEFVSVTVTVLPAAEPVAPQFTKPLNGVIAGLAGSCVPTTVQALGKTTVIVLPATSAPVELGVSPTVHVAAVPEIALLGLKVTALTLVALIVAFALVADVSFVVLTLLPLMIVVGEVVASGLVTPAIDSVTGLPEA